MRDRPVVNADFSVYLSGGGRCWSFGVGGFYAFGIALDAGGAFPSMELLGLGFVDVAHDGIEDVHFGVDEGELGIDEDGVFGAFLNFGFVVIVDFLQRIAVTAEVRDEGGIDAEGEEAGAQGGLGGFLLGGVSAVGDGGVVVLKELQEGVRVGADVFFDAVGDFVERDCKTGFPVAQFDGTGGGGDAFEVEQQGIEQCGLGDAVGGLTGAGGDDAGHAAGDVGDVLRDGRDGGGIGDVVLVKDEQVFSTGEAAVVAVVHGVGRFVGWVCPGIPRLWVFIRQTGAGLLQFLQVFGIRLVAEKDG